MTTETSRETDNAGDDSIANTKNAEADWLESNGGSSGENVHDVEKNVGAVIVVAESEKINVGFKRITELTSDDIKGLDFGSEDEACEFYRAYAKYHGFVIRKDEVSRDPKGNIKMRQLVCNREGSRHKKHLMRADRIREHRPLTRTNCPAKFRVLLDYKTSRWKVVGFEETHNHELIPTQVPTIPTHLAVKNAPKPQAESSHSDGVRSYYIMGFMLGQKGGYSDLSFCKKDPHNHLDGKKGAKIEDGDAFAALSYLQGKADNDPMMFAKFTTIDDGTLQHLFWSDGNSRMDFEIFGDVIAFDTTYKKNMFNKPLVIFFGSNHHKMPTIFGCALLADEKVESYNWGFETFLEAMFDKHPKLVVTDDNGEMRKAIKAVFPNATHRLCASQLRDSARENIKNAEFLEDFESAIYSNFSKEEFEDYWKEMIDKYELSENKWTEEMYKRKDMWATTYLGDSFFAGLRTTSQCEGINSFIETSVKKQNSLVDFLHNFERAVREYRNNELMDDFKSMYTDPVMTTFLHELEQGASKLYTRQIFEEVKKEIEDVGALNVIDRSEINNVIKFKINRYCKPRPEYGVTFDKLETKFLCDCRCFELRGIPCSHIFCAMKHEHLGTIPDSLICRRWTKYAKRDYIDSDTSNDIDSRKMFIRRFGALSTACNSLCHMAAQDVRDFDKARDEIFRLTDKLEHRGDPSSRHGTSTNMVGDPTLVRTGAPSKQKFGRSMRHSSYSKEPAHAIQTYSRSIEKETECGTGGDSSSANFDANASGSDIGYVSVNDTQTREIGLFQMANQPDNNEEIRPTKRQHKNATSRTQNSIVETDKHKVDDLPSDAVAATVTPSHNKLITYNPFNRGGHRVILPKGPIPAGQTRPDGFRAFSQGVTMFPSYPGIHIYPPMSAVPPVPVTPPENQHGGFSQFFGGAQNVQGGRSLQKKEERPDGDKEVKTS